MRRVDVVTSPRVEGNNTPLKIYEQLASGVPLVATEVLSHTQVLSKEQCFLAAVDDELLKGDSSAAGRLAELVEEDRRGWLPSQLLESVSAGFRVSRRSAEMVLGATVAE